MQIPKTAFALMAALLFTWTTAAHAAGNVRFTVAPDTRVKLCIGMAANGAVTLSAVAGNGCLSSSCNGFVRSTVRAELDRQKKSIRLTGHLYHRKPVGPAMCTRDCGGAKPTTLSFSDMKPGRYTLHHNNRVRGTVDLKPAMKRICFNG